MDTFTLDHYINHDHQDLNISSNNLILLSEMCLYRRTFLLKKEDVSSDIIAFLVQVGEEQIARDWTNIGYGTKDVSIDADAIPQHAMDANRNTTRAMTISNLLSKVLKQFVVKAKK